MPMQDQSIGNHYLLIHPNSNSNPTDKYRVARHTDLMRYWNGNALGYKYAEFDDYASAESYKYTKNNIKTEIR